MFSIYPLFLLFQFLMCVFCFGVFCPWFCVSGIQVGLSWVTLHVCCLGPFTWLYSAGDLAGLSDMSVSSHLASLGWSFSSHLRSPCCQQPMWSPGSLLGPISRRNHDVSQGEVFQCMQAGHKAVNVQLCSEDASAHHRELSFSTCGGHLWPLLPLIPPASQGLFLLFNFNR